LQADSEVKPAIAAMHQLASDLSAGKTISVEAARTFAEKWDDLEEIMKVYKPKRGQPGAERIIEKLSKKTAFTAEEKAQLTRFANISLALAIVTPHYLTGKKARVWKREWDADCRKMGEWSVDLLEGLKADHGMSIARAASKLVNTCYECHDRVRPPPAVPLPPLLPSSVGQPVELIGQATEYWFTRNWNGYYWREDFTFLIKDEKTGSTWRIVSREPTPAYAFRMGTTYTGLKVDWKSKPHVKIVGVDGIDRIPANFYHFKLKEPNRATALLVLVETMKGVWHEFYVNNWIHKWSTPVDKLVHGYFAERPVPYEVYGFVKGQRAPFAKKSQIIIDKHKDIPSLMFHGRIRRDKDSAIGFGHEIELIDLIGRDVRAGGHVLLHGDARTIPLLDSRKPGK
jgi:hypothetical protein